MLIFNPTRIETDMSKDAEKRVKLVWIAPREFHRKSILSEVAIVFESITFLTRPRLGNQIDITKIALEEKSAINIYWGNRNILFSVLRVGGISRIMIFSIFIEVCRAM